MESEYIEWKALDKALTAAAAHDCLLYTSDAADEL